MAPRFGVRRKKLEQPRSREVCLVIVRKTDGALLLERSPRTAYHDDKHLWRFPLIQYKVSNTGDSGPCSSLGDGHSYGSNSSTRIMSALAHRTNELLVQKGWDSISEELFLAQFVISVDEECVTQLELCGESDSIEFFVPPEYGPLPSECYAIVRLSVQGRLESGRSQVDPSCRWVQPSDVCDGEFSEGVEGSPRVDPLSLQVVRALSSRQCGSDEAKLPSIANHFAESSHCVVPSPFQEYPPRFFVYPQVSRTVRPFKVTNMVCFMPRNASSVAAPRVSKCASKIWADWMIVDPGTRSGQPQQRLAMLLGQSAAFRSQAHPLVFITHHHRDHVEALDTVTKAFPNALLVAHEKTLEYMAKEGYTHANQIGLIDSQQFQIGEDVIDALVALGHTDGHMVLYHPSSRTLIAGDHLAGYGSVVLDMTGGGDMGAYNRSTRKLQELRPRVIIPMHGRTCLGSGGQSFWILDKYSKSRRERKEMVAAALAQGQHTPFGIAKIAYRNVETKMWKFAYTNIALHARELVEEGYDVENMGWYCCGIAIQPSVSSFW